jgi:hypothetical protein
LQKNRFHQGSSLEDNCRMSIPLHKVFNDQALDDQFRRDGYVVIPLLNATEVQELIKAHDIFAPELSSDFDTTSFSPDEQYRRQVANAIDPIVQPHALPLLAGYKPILTNFISKRGSTKKGKVRLHQDYTFVDQSRVTGVHVWIPLIDVDENNGCLTVYPGTHSMVNHIAAFPSLVKPNYHWPWRDVTPLMESYCGIQLPMKAGEALFFNERLLHRSGENQTPGMRPCAVGAYIPEQETMRLYSPSEQDPNVLDILALDDPKALCFARPGDPLPRPYDACLRQIGTIRYHIDQFTPEQIRPLYTREPDKAEEHKPVAETHRTSQGDTKTGVARKGGLSGWFSRLLGAGSAKS